MRQQTVSAGTLVFASAVALLVAGAMAGESPGEVNIGSTAADCPAPTAPDGAEPHLDPGVRDWIDQRARELMQEYRSPGLSLAVVTGKGKPWVRHFGVRDIDSREAMPEQAAYQIGSVTKAFFGTLAARLAADGDIDLDRPVREYAPELRFHPTVDAAEITLRRLLSHQAGMPGNPANRRNLKLTGMPPGFDPTISTPYDIEDLLAGLPLTPASGPVGTGYRYSNLGMQVAAHVMAAATGHATPFAALKHYLLEPLCLRHTFVRDDDARDERMPTPYAFGDDKYHKVLPLGSRDYYRIPPWTFGTAIGGAGLSSTVEDLARFLSYLMNTDGSDGPLSSEALGLLLAPNVSQISVEEFLVQVSLGWRQAVFGDFGRIYNHSGHNDGHHSSAIFSRKHQVGVVSLTNGAYQANRRLAAEVVLHVLQAIAEPGAPDPRRTATAASGSTR